MNKTNIYLVRHAEVENPNHIIYGRLPGFDLSDRGIFQAEKLREYFATRDIRIIITSPLLRTKRTSEIISNRKIPIKVEKDILEANYSKWEGMLAIDRDPEEVKKYATQPDRVNLGETLSEVEKRMRKAILKAVKTYQGKNVVMVSHADPILVAKFSFEGKPLSEICHSELRNASITKLTFNEQGELVNSLYRVIVDAKRDLP